MIYTCIYLISFKLKILFMDKKTKNKTKQKKKKKKKKKKKRTLIVIIINKYLKIIYLFIYTLNSFRNDT